MGSGVTVPGGGSGRHMAGGDERDRLVLQPVAAYTAPGKRVRLLLHGLTVF